MRPLAIELTFDPDSDHRLTAVWSRLSRLYNGPRESELGMRPHITLALFAEREPSQPTDLVASLAGEYGPFELDLATVDHFPTGEGVVFLQPAPSAALRRAHAVLHSRLGSDRDLVHEYYQLPVWHPHCTMAINVPEQSLQTVLAVCRAEAVGRVQVVGLQLVRYRPATEIAGTTFARPSLAP
jgi:2'-5' RNA ligase